MEEGNKRKIEDNSSDSNEGKRIKVEGNGDNGLLDDELNALLTQGNDNKINGFKSNSSLDFNDLPDDLLDSIDRSVATPDFTRSSTPMTGNGSTNDNHQQYQQPSNLSQSDDLKRSSSGYPLNRDRNINAPTISHSQSQPQLPTYHQQNQQQQLQQPNQSSNLVIPSTSKNAELYSNDPSKLNDALAAAGVDIHHEEEYLLQQRNRDSRMNQQSFPNPTQRPPTNFLNAYNLSLIMQKTARENGVVQNFLDDPELLELMSVSCEKWMSDIITKTVIMSHHRQKGIPNVNKKPSAIQRSELSKELRNLAYRQKELEEKRVNKRIALGLEKSDDSKKDDNKGGADESLHRAANATAAMMSMNPSRKKYSWMTAGSGTSNGTAGATGAAGGDKEPAKKSHIMTARGENGLRYREIRTGQSVTMKDLLSAIEDQRIGVQKALLKGYSKLRD